VPLYCILSPCVTTPRLLYTRGMRILQITQMLQSKGAHSSTSKVAKYDSSQQRLDMPIDVIPEGELLKATAGSKRAEGIAQYCRCERCSLRRDGYVEV
jgi:hypothetical protein